MSYVLTTRWCDRSIPATNRSMNDSRRGSLESGIVLPPWDAGIDLSQSRCYGFFVSFTNKFLKHKNTATPAFRRLSHLHHPNLEVPRNWTRRCGLLWCKLTHHQDSNHFHIEIYHHNFIGIDLRYLYVVDSLSCVPDAHTSRRIWRINSSLN